MLHKVKNALLLTDVEQFRKKDVELAYDMDVKLDCESAWKKNYRIGNEAVITGSKFLDSINEVYYPSVVLILKEGEKPFPFIQMGIKHFIFDYKNVLELSMAFYKEVDILKFHVKEKLSGVLEKSAATRFIHGNYDFSFDTENFVYRGKRIFLSETAKVYLAEWLLRGKKDNNRRTILCNLRKSFGKTFLRDVDRFGQYKGELK